MQSSNRDLLVLSNTRKRSSEELMKEVAHLHQILFETENWQTFSLANEILDINRHVIIRKAHIIQKILTNRKQKPFVFVCNKN
jgi:hypothetical protein